MSEMLSQDYRIFSQDGNLSQLVDTFSQEKDLVNCEELNHSLHESEGKVLPEGKLSSKTQVICEENRQINRFIEGSLKKIEKKRLRLIGKENSINEQIKKYSKIHERQSQLIMEDQMNHEEWSEKYQNELNQRTTVKEKVTQTVKFFNVYEEYYAKAINIKNTIENKIHHYDCTFGMVLKKARDFQLRKNNLKLFFKPEINIAACNACKEDIMKEREYCNGVLESLNHEISEIYEKITEAQEKMKQFPQEEAEQNRKMREIMTKKAMILSRFNDTYEDLNHSKAKNASLIQDLKVQVNTEENENRNLEIKLQEKEYILNGFEKKCNELQSLLIQFEESIEEAQSHISEKAKEIDTCNKNISVLRERECFLNGNIRQNENVGIENQHFNDEIMRLDEEVKLNFNIFLEKKALINKVNKEMNNLKEALCNLQTNVFDLERELDQTQNNEKELILKVNESKLLLQQEREKKMSFNETLKKVSKELASDIEKATSELDKLHFLSDEMKKKKEEINTSIAQFNKISRMNNKKLLNSEEEWNKEVVLFEDKINLKASELEEYEDLILEAKPQQEQLIESTAVKESWEKELNLLNDTNQNKIEMLENNHRLKIQEMDCEKENYISIMENLLRNKEKETDILMEEIKEREKAIVKTDEDLKIVLQKLKKTKNIEAMKRMKIIKMNRRLDTITNEVKVTKKDIADAVTGNVQEPITNRRNKLMPPPSVCSSHSQYRKHMKMGSEYETSNFLPNISDTTSKQEFTRKWVESVPADEMEFSEV